MNKRHYAKIIFFSIILAAVSLCGRIQAQPANFEPNSTSKAGRDDPFASLFSKEKPTMQKVSQNLQPFDENPELFVETVTLKFLDAQNLKSAIAGMSSVKGTISIDNKSNSLIVCDTKENLEKILTQIRKADKRPKQIMIEVVLLDVKLNNEIEIGINWDMLTTKYNIKLDESSQVGVSFRQNVTQSARIASVDGTDADNIGNATAFNSILGKGADFALLFGDIRTVIHALQEKNNVEVLGSPRVMVLSGKNALIKSVEEVPYTEETTTGQSGVPMTYTKFKEIGVTLNVTATLTDDNLILLDATTSYDVASNTVAISGAPPTVDKREIKSSLLLKDGQILVIGGLRRKATQKVTNQIPILGDLPIIGLAFRDTIVTHDSSELLVILSPHIYKGQSPDDEQMAKFDEITKRPLLTIPEVEERRKEEEKEKALEKEAEKSKKVKK